ncbi:unnamed protein product [Rotaria socialis]|uniref:RRM domain-containing protein n=1 Tax=Rotaria socialis TaxID=392032 RepID=A0A818GR52_9BILA|nr:unnamed protein product [Rotaria socialis]
MSTTPKNQQPKEYNGPADNKRNSGGNRQRFKENMILVSGLPLDISEEHLLDKLWKINQQANKSSIHLFKDKVNRTRLTGSATITFEREESVMKAIEKYNGKCVPILNDNQIYVKKSEVTTGGNYATGRSFSRPVPVLFETSQIGLARHE